MEMIFFQRMCCVYNILNSLMSDRSETVDCHRQHIRMYDLYSRKVVFIPKREIQKM